MELGTVESFAQILSGVATSIGIFVAIITYKKQSEKDMAEREYGTFTDLDDKYVEFMYKCADNPDLDLLSRGGGQIIHPLINNYPNVEEFFDEMNCEKIKKERALFSVLISIFERSFVMYNCRCRDRDDLKRNQFEGWVRCMESYCLRPSFLYEWKMIGGQFDKNFYDFFEKMIHAEVKKYCIRSVAKQ